MLVAVKWELHADGGAETVSTLESTTSDFLKQQRHNNSGRRQRRTLRRSEGVDFHAVTFIDSRAAEENCWFYADSLNSVGGCGASTVTDDCGLEE